MLARGHFLTIEPDECRRLLDAASVGRVGWTSGEGIQVLPVNYAMSGDQIVFRVASGSVLEHLTEPNDVVFEVDDLDDETATGWSVVARGRSGEFEGGMVALPAAWAPGVRDVLVALTITSLSGRAVSSDAD
ncbi:MAG: pyridoxamine 5'-phosphate oxidase family protein [Propionibacteriaceae bacterium]|nr:pyridoxamine 5'-phosphate oxidase family protein [Propionibacteriaceae bacterium]